MPNNVVGIRYWAETVSEGRAYYGTTSMQTKPNSPRPFILAPSSIVKPIKFCRRLLQGKVLCRAPLVSLFSCMEIVAVGVPCVSAVQRFCWDQVMLSVSPGGE